MFRLLKFLIIFSFSFACGKQTGTYSEGQKKIIYDHVDPQTIQKENTSTLSTVDKSDKVIASQITISNFGKKSNMGIKDKVTTTESNNTAKLNNTATEKSNTKVSAEVKKQVETKQGETKKEIDVVEQKTTSESRVDLWGYSNKAGLTFFDQSKNKWVYQKEEPHLLTKGLLELLPDELKSISGKIKNENNGKMNKDDIIRFIINSDAKSILDSALSKVNGNSINTALSNISIEDKIVFEKIKVIHDFVALYLAYDIAVLNNINKAKYLTNDGKYFVNLVESRKALCGGYSLLFEVLCTSADIAEVECKTIEGTGNGFGSSWGSHAWSSVKVAGKWYLIDNTWDSGGIIAKGKGRNTYNKYEPKYTTSYLFADPKTFVNTHQPEDSEMQLLKEPANIMPH